MANCLDFSGTTSDRRFTFGAGELIGNVTWAAYVVVVFDSVTGFRCLMSIQNSSGTMVWGLFLNSDGNLRFYQPAGGGDSFTPSTAFTTGVPYLMGFSRVGTAAGDRNRYFAIRLDTNAVLVRTGGSVTVPAPATHAGGTLRLGQGDNNYYVDGKILAGALWIGSTVTTSGQEDALAANDATTDLYAHSIGTPSFIFDTDVATAGVGELTDTHGSLGLVEATVNNTSVVTDGTAWTHGYGGAPAPTVRKLAALGVG